MYKNMTQKNKNISGIVAVFIAFLIYPLDAFAADPLGGFLVMGVIIVFFGTLSIVFFLSSILISKRKKLIVILYAINIGLFFVLPKSEVQIWSSKTMSNYPDLEYILAYLLISTFAIFCFSLLLRLIQRLHKNSL